MPRPRPLSALAPALLALTLHGPLAAQDEPTFRSEVAVIRVDAQVINRDGRPLMNLQKEDFLLREEGTQREIRYFAREEVPLDVALLLDVSGSMRPHVERVAAAAHEALQSLGDNDRVAILVFDRQTRLRLPLRNSREDVERALDLLLRQEDFDGGTDITRGLYDTAEYLRKNARADSRRAIVILTDDRTERQRDEPGVGRALAGANIVLSALLAPDAIGVLTGGGGGGMGGPPVFGGGGPLGGIIFGRRGPWGNRMPGGGGPTISNGRLQSAGTANIARDSGGDSMNVDDASSLTETLARIRQRYTLHFHLPEGARPGQERNIEVELSAAAGRRYPNADVRFRRVYLVPDGSSPTSPEPTVLSRGPAPGSGAEPAIDSAPPPRSTSSASRDGGWRRSGESAQPGPTPEMRREPTPVPEPKETQPPKKGGWRRAAPGEQ